MPNTLLLCKYYIKIAGSCISIQLNYNASTRPALIIVSYFFFSLELKCRPIYLMWYGIVLCGGVWCGVVGWGVVYTKTGLLLAQ